MDDERNSLGGRVRRYARVSTAVGGIAARFGAEKVLGLKGDPGRRAAELTAALGGLKGPLMKVAQILSTIPDALPREYAAHLSQLQSNAPEMGWPFVKRRMASELGANWQSRFRSFGHEAAAAASLGQVHKAVGLDGRSLACKLQYPDMASAVEADLRQLKVIFAVYRGYDNAIDPSDIHAEIADRLREELDYGREARHMRLYRRMLDGQAGVTVPEVVEDLSTRRLLTMTWVDGRRVLDFKDHSLEERNAVAMNMFHAWYVPFYRYGVIHGDPHLGNYTVRDDHGINLLDFGAIRVFPPSFVKGVIDLYHALDRSDRDLAVEAYRIWGFRNLTNEVIDALNLWAAFLYGPLLENRPRLINETPQADFGREVAEKVHAELRRLGGIRPPREFVLMDRAAIGLGSVFLHLRAEINWHRLFHDMIADFDVAAMQQRQAAVLAEVGLAAAQ